MATRISPSLPGDGLSVFELRSGHGRYLLTENDFLDTPQNSDTSVAKKSEFEDFEDGDFVNDAEEETAGDEKTISTYLSLFPHRSESVVRYSDYAEWREVSRFHELSDEEIISSLRLDSKLKRAVRFNAVAKLSVIHVPFDSQYQNIPSATLLKQQFKNLGATLKHYQYNTDWYFCLFFSQAIDSCSINKPLERLLEAAGFVLSADKITVLSADMPVPLPVQPGFAWINDRGAVSVRRDEISLQGALALFVADASRYAVNAEKFISAIMSRPELANSIKTPQSDAQSDDCNDTRNVNQTTISLLESVGLNVNDQDRIACFTVFEAPLIDVAAQQNVAVQPQASARTLATVSTRTKESIAIKKRIVSTLEPGPDASDADYLRKLGQALRRP